MPTQYVIHNAARSVHSRTARAQGASHRGLKQHVLDTQKRLVRGRPLTISEEELKRNLPELKKKAAQGLIHVKTTDGRHVNLDTLEAGPAPAPAPKPNPPLDTVARDQQHVGEERGVFPEGPFIPHGGGGESKPAEEAPEPTAADFNLPSDTATVDDHSTSEKKAGGKKKGK